MRKVTFGGATSLDGYIARLDQSVDWLLWGKEAAAIMQAYWRDVDTVLMGRKTYEVALRHGGGGGGDTSIRTYVFSRTVRQDEHPGATIVSEDAVPFVRELKEGKGKEICLMGGGELARPLFEAGLIDEIGFNVHPVLLGSGVPLFHRMGRQIDLELLKCSRFENGCVYVSYRVRR